MSHKMTTEEEEFDVLRKHILACTKVPKESRAIHAALQGLDTEVKRMERDAKLKRKFTTSTTTKTETKMENEKRSTERTAAAARPVNYTSNSSNAAPSDEDELMEWQNVASNKEPGSLLGSQLAHMAVGTMARHGTAVNTPLAAISLALHAALCTDMLGFVCTGIPETEASQGFAAPIRELSKNHFVPPKWDDNDNEIRLRYRKAAVGSVALSVLRSDQVRVSLTPTKTNEPPSESLIFNMEDHVNLASFEKALAKEGSVLPALHYKALTTLLTNFVNTFDLGSIRDAESTPPEMLPYVNTTIAPQHPPSEQLHMMPLSDPLRVPSRRQIPLVGHPDSMGYNPYENPTIQVFQPARPSRGDFAGDLQPPGIPGGDFMGSGGNLMGPNHPIFNGDNMMPGGGFGMRPRYDHVGPPGGPQDPNNDPLRQPLRRRPPPGGLGEPNPDHARPPSNLNNNMFM